MRASLLPYIRRGVLLWGMSAGFSALACRSSAPPAQDPPPPASTASAAAPADAACGGTNQKECPTQRWMKATLQAYLRTRDYKRLESSFKMLAERGPAGYDKWGEMAELGARGAAASDEAMVRQSCQNCHDSYRAQFREQHRTLELL
jgi:hypothetical protein